MEDIRLSPPYDSEVKPSPESEAAKAIVKKVVDFIVDSYIGVTKEQIEHCKKFHCLKYFRP